MMGYKIENIHKDLIIYTNGVPSAKEFHKQKVILYANVDTH